MQWLGLAVAWILALLIGAYIGLGLLTGDEDRVTGSGSSPAPSAPASER